jgi:hypothetical protein
MTKHDHESAVQDSLSYLSSDEAIKDIDANPYWPKWNAPWWHMSVLFEMGMATRIPKRAAEKLLSEVKRTHLPYFFREDAPADKASDQDAPCPCAFGNIYQILNAAGLNVDLELPWARGWFLKYQMPDGGLSCDEDAYKADPNSSSLVGTIAPLEAILSITRKLSADEEQFLDRGAKCLIDRELRLGSSSKFNADERLDEEDWLKPCFPRFYFYDVLRGLSFVLKWADLRNQIIPKDSIVEVVKHLELRSTNGQICIERHSFEGVFTKLQSESWDWKKRQPATHFPLLDQVSKIGSKSPYLTARWKKTQNLMLDLTRRGLLK